MIDPHSMHNPELDLAMLLQEIWFGPAVWNDSRLDFHKFARQFLLRGVTMRPAGLLPP